MIEIIPAIDIIDGKCVRLEQGDFSRRTIYEGDPLEAARRFEAAGLTRLHIVDLDGAKLGRTVNLGILESIAASTGLVVDFGGGIGTLEDVRRVFDAGASFASVGSVAVRDMQTFTGWLEHFGADRFFVGADVRDRYLAVNGWQTTTEIEVIGSLTDLAAIGLETIFVTDITRDGCLKGPSVELYRDILDSLPDLHLIASGGVSAIEDIHVLENIGCRGVIIGKAIYEGRIALNSLARIQRGE